MLYCLMGEREASLGRGVPEVQPDHIANQSQGMEQPQTPEEIQQARDSILEQWRGLPENEQTQVLVDMFVDIQEQEGRWEDVWREIELSTLTWKEGDRDYPLLTSRQYGVLEYVSQYIDEEGYPPAMGDIGNYFSVDPKTAYSAVQAIEWKGYIERKKGVARGIRLIVPMSDVRAKHGSAKKE